MLIFVGYTCRVGLGARGVGEGKAESYCGNVLMRLSTVEPVPFLAAIALVVEKDADCRAAVTGPGCVVWRFRVSWQAREIDGRTGAIDMGILKTFARDARAGDKDFIVMVVLLGGGSGKGSMQLSSTGNNSLTAESCPPVLPRAC
jgi:hypothetical protein